MPCFLALGLFVVSTTSLAPVRAGAQEQAYDGTGAQACLACHESEAVMGIRETPHANFDDPRSPAAKEQCESCHGPSATHMNFPMQVGNIVFTKHGKTPIRERNQVCLTCHHEGEEAHWNEGAHGANLSCVDCHTIHVKKDPTLAKEGQGDRCGTCHAPILASAPKKAPHVITGAGAMNCTNCHNPHGPTNLASCNACHPQDMKAMAAQSSKAREYHERAVRMNIDCTRCHKGFVHALPVISTSADVPDDF